MSTSRSSSFVVGEQLTIGAIEFNKVGDFQAAYAAEDWLRVRGFSVGPMQGAEPRAIWHGDCYVSKWRGLNPWDKRDMHARMNGDMRNGPVRITLLDAAPDEARAAFSLTDAAAATKNEEQKGLAA